MASVSARKPGRTLVGLCAAAMTVVALLPGSSAAEPPLTLDEAQQRVDALYHESEIAAERTLELESQIIATEQELQQIQADIAHDAGLVDQLSSQVGQLAVSSYVDGFTRSSQVFFAEDAEEMMSQWVTVDALAAQQSTVVDGFQTAVARLERQEALAGAQVAELDAARAAQSTEQERIDANLAEAQALLDSLTEEQRREMEARAAAAEQASRDAARAALEAVEQSDAAPADQGGEPQSQPAGGAQSSSSEPEPAPSSAPVSGSAQVAVEYALAQVGDRYVYGATGPDAWDCSSLLQASWRQAGVTIPRTSRAQYSGAGARVSISDLRPGDLVFYYSPISHAAMYIGNGQIVHASNPSRPVNVADLRSMPITGAVRPG